MAAIAIHGGAGAIAQTQLTPAQEQRYLSALHSIALAGRNILDAGGSALDAVTHAVVWLENNPLFNAGYGAVLTATGTHELDAALMDGHTRMSGAVACVRTIKNPILAARAVLEHSEHVFFTGEGAEHFAAAHGLDIVDPAYFTTSERAAQLARAQAQRRITLDHDTPSAPLDESRKMGTVGAVALDHHGHLAAATSTGGMTNKQNGRIGDSPIIGAGCYANATCAVSTTGTGETFIRAVAAYDLAALMDYAHLPLNAAAERIIHHHIPALGGSGGLIAIDRHGNISLPFNSEGMYRAYARSQEAPRVGIYAQLQELTL